MIRVLIADDHDSVRRALTLLLTSYPDLTLVGEASTGEEAISLCSLLVPDVLVLDLYMPDGDGISVTQAVKEMYPKVEVIILSNSMNGDHLQAALDAGATTYLAKFSSTERLIHAIRATQAA